MMYFGIIGNGAAGGNIADEFAKEGFEAIAINYSKKDLDSLDYVKDKLGLIGSEGTGKDRDAAMNLMNNNWESVINFIQKNMSQPSIEIILVVYSCSGGSGSGISNVIIDLLKDQMPNKTIVACPILPSNDESLVNLINTQSTLSELYELDTCVLPIDNNSLLVQENKKLPKNLLYNTINKRFVHLIKTVAEYTNKHSKNGIIDKKDLKQIYNTKGISIISKCNITDMSNLKLESPSIIENIQKSWSSPIFSPIQFDQIIRAGIIFDGNEQFMEYLNYNELFGTFKNHPIDLFEGNFHEYKGGKVISILSGLNWINTRVKELDDVIDSQKKIFEQLEVSSYKSKNTNKTDLFKVTGSQKPIPKNRSISEILKKYSR